VEHAANWAAVGATVCGGVSALCLLTIKRPLVGGPLAVGLCALGTHRFFRNDRIMHKT
jgi:hypothetical protein